MSLRDFRLLFASTTTSLLGNQFTLIATPWLALQLTGDAVALGTVLALESIPRAAFMLIGGAITDRFHPRRVMLVTDLICFALVALMATLVFLGSVTIWMLYAFALSFGVVCGLATPATNSIVPMLVCEQDLEAGNSVIMGMTQLAGFVGPTLAGIMIGLSSSSVFGVGCAFAIDALSFVLSALFLLFMQNSNNDAADALKKENVWQSMVSGAQYAWNDGVLRFVIVLFAIVNFLVIGPITVGIPLLVDQRLASGAGAFGMLMSAFAGGSLLGFFAAGAMPRPSGRAMRFLILCFVAVFGVVIAGLGHLSSLWLDFALLFMLGTGNGYLAILLFTWMQNRTPKIMLGRMMSLLFFANAGLVPISQALSGLVGSINLSLLFSLAGVLVVLTAVVAAFRQELHALSAGITTRAVVA